MGKKTKKRKKAVLRKKKEIFPGTESRKVFSAAVSLAKELIDSDGMTIRVDRDGDATLFVDGGVLKELSAKRFSQGLTRDLFKELIETELTAFVRTTMYEDPRDGIKREFPDRVLKELETHELKWRLEKVREMLVPSNLKERVMLRRTTKGLILDRITWELGIKKHDQVKGPLDEIPYANLVISYASPLTNGPAFRARTKEASLEIPMISEPKQLNLELHEADVEEMIKILSLVRDNLRKMREEK